MILDVDNSAEDDGSNKQTEEEYGTFYRVKH